MFFKYAKIKLKTKGLIFGSENVIMFEALDQVGSYLKTATNFMLEHWKWDNCDISVFER